MKDVEIIDDTHIKMNKPAILDIGAMGKGFLIDKVEAFLQSKGFSEFSVDAGGDILHTSSEPITIGLENPQNIKQVIGVVELGKGAIAGSAGNRRQWDKYHHIVNPKTKTSPEEIIAVWVIATNATTADGLSTCLFFVEPERLLKQYEFEYLIINKQMQVRISEGFPGKLFK